MKLYVWTEFEPEYTPGLAFAIADNVDEARELVKRKFREQFKFDANNFGSVEEFELTEKIAFARCGGA